MRSRMVSKAIVAEIETNVIVARIAVVVTNEAIVLKQ